MTITVVGAGMAGAACARTLHDAGVAVRVLERGKAPGGRLAAPLLHGRRVDLGAAYFTVRDPGFQNAVDGWAAAGLARPWTDTFAVLGDETRTTTGPLRWGTAQGLRSLARSVLEGVDVELGTPVETRPDGVLVLAMPDPQAARLAAVPDAVDYDPVIAVALGYPERTWQFDAAFVHGHPDVEFVADDGARRGDGAPVLVAHSTAQRARRHLDDPQEACASVVGAVRELLGLDEPSWTHVHRWTFAKPAATHDASFGRADGVWLAGDQWCPSGSPRVESAWLSGVALARHLVESLDN